MDALTLANYILKQANNNEATKEIITKAIEKIKENDALLDTKAASENELQHLSMEVFNLKKIANECVGLYEAQLVADETANAAYSSFLKALGQLQLLNLEHLINNRLQSNKLELQQKGEELEKQSNEQLMIYDEMKNRHIVQQMFEQRQRYEEAQEKLKRVQLKNLSTLNEAKKKLALAKAERNEVIVNVVKGAKTLQMLREANKNPETVHKLMKKFDDIALAPGKKRLDEPLKCVENKDKPRIVKLNIPSFKISDMFNTVNMKFVKFEDVEPTSAVVAGSYDIKKDNVAIKANTNGNETQKLKKHVKFSLLNNIEYYSTTRSEELFTETEQFFETNAIDSSCDMNKKETQSSESSGVSAPDLNQKANILHPTRFESNKLLKNDVPIQSASKPIEEFDKKKSHVEILECKIIKEADAMKTQSSQYFSKQSSSYRDMYENTQESNDEQLEILQTPHATTSRYFNFEDFWKCEVNEMDDNNSSRTLVKDQALNRMENDDKENPDFSMFMEGFVDEELSSNTGNSGNENFLNFDMDIPDEPDEKLYSALKRGKRAPTGKPNPSNFL